MANLNSRAALVTEIEAVLPSLTQVMERAEHYHAGQEQMEELTKVAQVVLGEFRREMIKERSDQLAYIESRNRAVFIDFAVDITGLLIGDKFRPRPKRIRLARPFGSVMIAVGPEGLPDGLFVFNMSQLARDRGVPVSQVEAEANNEGKVLFTDDNFEQLIAGLKSEVSQGKARLPHYPSERIMPKN